MEWEEIFEYIMLGAVLLALIVLIVVLSTIPKKNMTTKEIAICAMCLGLSFALSYAKFSPVANGGSVTVAAIVPLSLYCYFAGVRKGLLAAFAYALLQIIQEPFALTFVQVLLDYILPFSVFGLMAALKKFRTKLKGYDFLIMLFLAYLFRYLCHVTIGAVPWGPWQVGWIPSFIYSATYVPADFGIAAVVLVALIQTKTVLRLEKIYLTAPRNAAVRQADPVEITEQPEASAIGEGKATEKATVNKE